VKPKPVVHQPRRPPYSPPAPPPVVGWVAPPPKPDWHQLLVKLPKEQAGGVDWDSALEEKLIAPKAGIEPDAPDQPVFDLTLELVPEGQEVFKATFPHKEHTEWLTCANCHTGIFKMQRGGDPITMAKIYAGEYCGRCHGKVSFAVPTGCPRCHLALAGPK
jgi:c(7)-type cytochrome triheme protein